jgi:glucokinase
VRGVISRLGATATWDGYPLRATLAASLGAPVAVASATGAGALAEAERFGKSPGQRALYVSNGRTITSALVVDGVVEGGEGQLGHLRVWDEGPRCSCGLRGHLEPIASAQSIVRTMIGRASGSDESHAAMLRISGGRAEAMTASQVVALAEQGDPIATDVVGVVLDALAIALADVVAVAAPSVVILGGPLVEAGEGFIGRLRERVVALVAPFAVPPVLRWGMLEPFAALLGAALVAELA